MSTINGRVKLGVMVVIDGEWGLERSFRKVLLDGWSLGVPSTLKSEEVANHPERLEQPSKVQIKSQV